MRTKIILLIMGLLLLNSCIVKSLQPFYIKKSLSFNEQFIGSWTDNKNGNWEVVSFVEAFNEDRKPNDTISEDDKKAYENYKDGYLVNYVLKDKEAGFIVMPFKIGHQLFLDFTPIEFEQEEVNDLAVKHLLNTHTVAKLDFDSDNNLQLSWLSEEPLKNLYEDQSLRLKYEKVGFDETLLLTASSEELFAFLKKYMIADVEDQWSKDQLKLERNNVKP